MKYRKKFSTLLVSVVAASLTTSAACAAPVIWNLNSVSFADGGTASGSFTYDADIDQYSAWTIAVAGGTTAALPAYTYTSASGFQGIHSASAIDFVAIPVVRYLRLTFASPLTNAGGTTALIAGTAFECDNCTIRRNIVAGSVTTAVPGAVPEPTSWALMLMGFGATGYALRRKNKLSTVVTFG